MSARNLVLFNGGEFTLAMRLQLADRGVRAPPMGFVALDSGRGPSRQFRLFWDQVFPTRDPLPFVPLAEPDGRGTTAFWDVFE